VETLSPCACYFSLFSPLHLGEPCSAIFYPFTPLNPEPKTLETAPLLLLPLGKLCGDEDGSTHSVNDLMVALSKQAETFRSLSSKARRQGKMAAAEETSVKLCHSIADAVGCMLRNP